MVVDISVTVGGVGMETLWMDGVLETYGVAVKGTVPLMSLSNISMVVIYVRVALSTPFPTMVQN